MTPTFDHTLSILVKAYLNDELAHKVCSACAVGNIVANALGTKPKKTNNITVFDNVYFENGERTRWYNALQWNDELGEQQIKATGYSNAELYRIEKAFENAPGQPEGDGIFVGMTTDPTWMFNGLMAVVDVLAEIHGVDLTQKEQAKLLFQK